MNVLVTGVSGFLAPHVAAILGESGHRVIGCDTRPEVQPAWASEPLWREYRQVGLDTVAGALQAVAGVDAICHLAGVGDVYLAFERPEVAATANVVATACVLEAARQSNVRRFVYASTWEVYGTPRYQPLDEAHPCDPDHPYNITKYAGERLVMAYDHLKDLPGVCLRLGTAYGAGMRPNSVFSTFIQRALRGEPITIAGDGSQGRQFTHARDIGNAFRLAVESELRGEALNTVAGEMVSVRRLAEAVTQRFPTEIVFGPPRVGDIAPSSVSSARAGDRLGWFSQIGIEDGLEELFREGQARHAAAPVPEGGRSA
jgi:UDP-glucose 4-epimerase